MVGSEVRYLNPDERSTGALVRNALLKDDKDGEVKSSPGIYISKRSLSDVLDDVSKKSRIIYLKENGEDVREHHFEEDVTFVLSDNVDLSQEEEEKLLSYGPAVLRLGPISYHADHCITIMNNELDLRAPRTTTDVAIRSHILWAIRPDILS